MISNDEGPISMLSQSFTSSITRLQSLKHGAFAPLFAVIALAFLCGQPTIVAQAAPREAYGPYNANVLPDGSGLIKSLAPPPPLDSRYTGPQSPDTLTAGDAPWTLAFWFNPSDPLKMASGSTLLAGFGNPTDTDARFIGVKNNHLGIWLGTTQGKHLLTATMPLGPGDWHFAAAVSDGQHVTLYADGLPLATWPLMQGTIAPQNSTRSNNHATIIAHFADHVRKAAVTAHACHNTFWRAHRCAQNLPGSARRR